MWGDVDCSLSQGKGSLDLGRHSEMFRPSCRSSSPFSLSDLDMWDTKSRFAAQTSAWCGMATVSGTGFLSKVSTSTSGSTGGFRQSDSGLKKWQSLSHLVPEGPTPSFAPSPGGELRAAQGASSFRQAEVQQWLQDAHERLDTQLDRLTTRNSQLSYNITAAELFDMKHKQLSEAAMVPEQEKEVAKLPQFEKSRQHGELHEKVQRLEKDLLQMRSSLDRGSNDQPADRTNGPLGRRLPMSQDAFNRQERQMVDTELWKLREALKDAESRAKTQEEERNQALQELKTSTETQRELLLQIEEMNQRINHMRQNYSEVQEQLSEANNKISQACLEKAILSTQVLKLEDNIKELRAKLSDKDHLIQDKADSQQRAQVLELQLGVCSEVIQTNTESHNNKQETVLMKEESAALREVNEKLACELETTKQKLNTSQSQLQEITAERVISSKQISDLQAECSQLIREKDELHKINEGQYDELTEMKDRCCKLREFVKVLELEKLKLQDRCLCLETEVLEKEEKLQLQEEALLKQDAVRVQSTDELKAVVGHWTEKWQKVALTLQSTQEELEQLKKRSRNELQAEAAHVANEMEKLKKEGQKDKEKIENLLQQKANMETVLSRTKVELDACKHELELQRSRSPALLHRYKDEGGEASVQIQDKETLTGLSQSSLLRETPSDSPQASEEGQDDGSQALRAQLEENNRSINQLQQEKTLAVQKLQALRQFYPEKDEKPSSEGRNDKTVCPVNVDMEQQRRMITEQLKSLFKEREGKEDGKVDGRSAAAHTGASSLQDWTTTCKPMRSALDRRSWQQSSGLMPVFEEDEESTDWSGGEEGEPAEEAHAEENAHNQNKQISSMSEEISDLKTKNVDLLQDLATLRCQQLEQDCPPAAEEDKSCVEVPNLLVSHCSDETDLQQKTTTFVYPDGIFLAELVNLSSPDEDEEEGGDK